MWPPSTTGTADPLIPRLKRAVLQVPKGLMDCSFRAELSFSAPAIPAHGRHLPRIFPPARPSVPYKRSYRPCREQRFPNASGKKNTSADSSRGDALPLSFPFGPVSEPVKRIQLCLFYDHGECFPGDIHLSAPVDDVVHVHEQGIVLQTDHAPFRQLPDSPGRSGGDDDGFQGHAL